MNDDHPPSLMPVVHAIAGFFIAVTTFAIPLYAVTWVRFSHEGSLPKKNGHTTEANTQRKFLAVDARRDLRVSSVDIYSRSHTMLGG